MEKVEEVKGEDNNQGCERKKHWSCDGRFGVMAGISKEMGKSPGINIITERKPFDYFLSTDLRIEDLIVF